MRRQKLDTAVRRPQLAHAVLEVIGERGIEGLSVAAVARRVGISPSAIYRHFQSKDVMLDAVVDLIRERLLGNLETVRAGTPDPFEALELLLARHLELIRANRALSRIIFSEDFFMKRPERRRGVYGAMTLYLAGIADLVRAGQRAGRMRPDLDPPTVAVMFMGLLQPAAILWSLSDGGFDVTRQVRAAWPVFRRAIAMPDDTVAPRRPTRARGRTNPTARPPGRAAVPRRGPRPDAMEKHT
jgi:AcrR family transcriptional regulator